jgi:hypothetical protein
MKENAVGLGGEVPCKKKVVFVATLPPNYDVLCCAVMCMFTPRRSCSLRLRLQ